MKHAHFNSKLTDKGGLRVLSESHIAVICPLSLFWGFFVQILVK